MNALGIRFSQLAPSVGKATETDPPKMSAVLNGVFRFSNKQAVVGNLTDYGGGVRVNNDLTQWVIRPDRLRCICGNVLEKTKHGRNSFGVNAVLRFFQADYALCLRVKFQNC